MGQGKLTFDPSGKRILGHVRTGNAPVLAWVDLESGRVVPALEPPRGVPAHALSPDGTAIAFATSQDVPGEQGGNDGPGSDLWILPLSEREPRKLARFPSRVFDLTWAGEELVVSSDLGGAHTDLWAVPPREPDRARKLTSGQADEDSPTFAAGRLIYTDNREGATMLVDRDVASGDERVVPVTGIDYGRPTGTASLEIMDATDGTPLVARVSLQEEGGKAIAPPGSLYRLHGDAMDFYLDRSGDIELPAGTYILRAWHGIEYTMAREAIELGAGARIKVPVRLHRWTNPAANGLRSGESHIHANYGYGAWYCTPSQMRLMVQGEGLEIANFMVANSDTDGIFDREFFRGRPDPLSTPETILYWNEEFRATLWGHMTLLELRQLVEPIMTGFKETTNPWDAPTNADIADRTHLQHGHVNYTHAAQNLKDPYLSAYSAKALPVDVALGKIDSLDINGSYEAAVPLWYRLLNCGFRLPASAGTDCFLNRIRSKLPGSDRAYVRCEGALDYSAWVTGLRFGRSFVTNGPMLEFPSGDRIRLDGPGSAPVRASVVSPEPLDRFEMVYNGRVLATGTLSADRKKGTIEVRAELPKSGWLSVRAMAGRLQAHASPVYVDVAGTAAGSKADAEYFLAWIDRLEEQLRKRDRVPTDALKKDVASQLQAARDVYRRISSRSE
jgi:hypothetical protein